MMCEHPIAWWRCDVCCKDSVDFALLALCSVCLVVPLLVIVGAGLVGLWEVLA